MAADQSFRKQVGSYLAMLTSNLTQYDQKLSARERTPNIYRLSHYLGAVGEIRAAVSGMEHDTSPEAHEKLLEAIRQRFGMDTPSGKVNYMPPVSKVVKAIVAGKGARIHVTPEVRRRLSSNPVHAPDVPLSDLYQQAFDAGKHYRTSGDWHTSGVANARVVRYGFLKWLPWDRFPQGVTKAKLEKAFREGYAAGKRTEVRNPHYKGPDVLRDIYSWAHSKEEAESIARDANDTAQTRGGMFHIGTFRAQHISRESHLGKHEGWAVVGDLTGKNPRRGGRKEVPVIHVYGEKHNWTFSMELPYADGSHQYSHHFDLAFPTAQAAAHYAKAHIGKPDYGGDLGTVLNWRHAKVKIHRQGWEPAGIYALGPSVDARKMPAENRRRKNNRRSCNPRGSRAKGQHLYAVHVPKTEYDLGYTLEIRARTKAAARKEAKAYCAGSFHKYTGRPKSQYRLPRATTVKEIRK